MKKYAVLFVLIFWVMVLYSCQPGGQSETPGEQSVSAAPVKVFAVQRQRISEKLLHTGLIEAWREINITPDIGGKIAKIHVDEGASVNEGQLLAELDTRAIRLQLEQAEAGLAVAEANFNDAKRNKERMERLNEEKAVSEQQYEKIRLAYEAAEAQLQQARAAVNLAKHNFEVSLMRAPFTGVVASKNAEVGDVINPMMGGFSPQSGVLTLMDFSRVKIAIDVSQQDAVRIRKGQRALVAVPAYPGRSFEGRVSLVNMTADPMTKKFKVEVVVPNPGLLLRPNTYGEVTFVIDSHEDALVIPQKAVLENTYVFVALEDTVERRDVVLGLQNTERVEVVQGLQEGDLVVVEGNFGLESGSKIDIKEVIR